MQNASPDGNNDRAGGTTRILAHLPIAVLTLLLLLSPLAISFEPRGVHRSGLVPQVSARDMNNGARTIVIAAGLIGACLAALAASLRVTRTGAVLGTTTSLAAAVLSVALGWCLFPYWANGVYVAHTMSVVPDLDPKALPPMTWIGEFWRLPAAILWPSTAVCQAAILAIAVRQRRQPLSRLTGWRTIAAVAAIHLCCFAFLSPGFFAWLLD